MYLLDTNVVSADAPAKRRVGPEAFAAWVRENGDHLYISTVTIAEIEAGIARAVRIGATTKAERLRRWLAAVEHFYSGHILASASRKPAWPGPSSTGRVLTIPVSRTSPLPPRLRRAASRS